MARTWEQKKQETKAIQKYAEQDKMAVRFIRAAVIDHDLKTATEISQETGDKHLENIDWLKCLRVLRHQYEQNSKKDLVALLHLVASCAIQFNDDPLVVEFAHLMIKEVV